MKNINITLNTENDIKKFDKKIWIYKSFFYKNVEFKLENGYGDKQYDDIIQALNIKNKKERIDFIYDKACDTIDNYNQEQHINCGFNKDGKCINQYTTDRINGCCSLCRYQSEKGCKSKNLSCKLFFCDQICEKYKIVKFRNLKILKCLSLRRKIIAKNNFFVTRENFLKELYSGSLIMYSIKTSIGIVKNIAYMYKLEKRNKNKI